MFTPRIGAARLCTDNEQALMIAKVAEHLDGRGFIDTGKLTEERLTKQRSVNLPKRMVAAGCFTIRGEQMLEYERESAFAVI